MAKEYKRTDRIAELMQRELARLIQFEIKDPRVALVSVYAVSVTSDLSNAKVYVSRYGDETEITQCVEALNRAAGFLRTQLAAHIQLRRVPQLHFIYDKSVMEGNRLAALIDQAAPPEPTDETE